MSAQTRAVDFEEPLKLYWQPGCTACLRMKEFFTRHGVDYISINVLTDTKELQELVQLAGRHIPIARRGNDWADGQVLSELARIGGIDLGSEQPVKFIDFSAPAGGSYESWKALIAYDALKKLFAVPSLELRKSTTLPNGKTDQTVIAIDTLGLEAAWQMLSASGCPAPVSAGMLTPANERR